MKNKVWFLAAAVVLLAGCAKDEQDYTLPSDNVIGNTMTIGATYESPENETKSDISDGKFTWSEGDEIWMGSDKTTGTESWSKFTLASGKGESSATFNGGLDGDNTDVAAVFPATVNPSYDKANSKLSLTLPTEITWESSEIVSNGMQADNIMVAGFKTIYTDGIDAGTTDGVTFKNVGGLFRLTLNSLPSNATKLVFTTDKKINGTFEVVEKDGNLVIETDDPADDSEKSVTVNFTTDGTSPKVFFIPVPIGEYMISFAVKDETDAEIWSFSASRPNTVGRAKLIAMPALTYDHPAVAQIGSTTYETLAEAIAAVPADGTQTTITMIADAEVDATASGLVVPADKNIVLELNGRSIVGTCTSGATSALITNNGTLTIQDSSDSEKNGSGSGKLTYSPDPVWVVSGSDYSGSYASNLITNRGSLTVEGGLLQNTGLGSATYAVDNYNAASLTVNGGKLDAAKSSAVRLFSQNGGSLTVNGGIIGHYTSSTDCSYMGVQVQSAGASGVTVTINGGKISGDYSFYAGSGTAWSNSHFTITGGLFEQGVGFTGTIPAEKIEFTGGEYHSFVVSYSKAKFIKGGKFTADPTAADEDGLSMEACLAEGYKFVTEGDYWTVVHE